MNYIIYDLEFNQRSTGNESHEAVSALPFEIIQIGALKLNESFETISTFNTFVKPTVHTEIHPFIESLTGINNSTVHSYKNFPEVYREFLSFSGDDEIVLCVWGTVDIKELLRNIKFHRLPDFNFKLFIDVQRYASRYFRCSKGIRIGLKNAVENLNISSENEFHDAFNDAFYTSEVLKIIYDDSVTPKVYNPKTKAGRTSNPKETVDENALIGQFEKMYDREFTEEEKSMLKLAYYMGKTRQFIK